MFHNLLYAALPIVCVGKVEIYLTFSFTPVGKCSHINDFSIFFYIFVIIVSELQVDLSDTRAYIYFYAFLVSNRGFQANQDLT